MPTSPLYKNSPLTFFPPKNLIPVGYTQRRLPVQVSNFSGQRTVQTYVNTVSVISFNGLWLWDESDNSPRRDLQGRVPYQAYRIFTTTLSSPDGDLPYKKGDYFVPTGTLVGLVANTQYGIRGVKPSGYFYELTIEAHI